MGCGLWAGTSLTSDRLTVTPTGVDLNSPVLGRLRPTYSYRLRGLRHMMSTYSIVACIVACRTVIGTFVWDIYMHAGIWGFAFRTGFFSPPGEGGTRYCSTPMPFIHVHGTMKFPRRYLFVMGWFLVVICLAYYLLTAQYEGIVFWVSYV